MKRLSDARTIILVAAFTLLGAASGMEGLRAQSPPPAAAADLPFGPGEVLEYQVKLGSLGSGRAVMRVGEPERVRDAAAWPLTSELRARVTLAVVKEEARSWLDPGSMASLRYEKQESSPLSSFRERVEIFPDEQRWAAAGGAGGRTPSDAPLDEVSFIYLIRTLPLKEEAVYRFDRHFDPARNPVVVRIVGHERITVPAGTFNAVVVEMDVTDERRSGGRGTLRFHFSNDTHRIPLRIESAMPVVGRSVLSLERWTPGDLARP